MPNNAEVLNASFAIISRNVASAAANSSDRFKIFANFNLTKFTFESFT